MELTDLVQAIQTLNAEDAFRPRFDAQQWRTLGSYMTRHDLRAGDMLIRQGDHDRTVYFLAQGSLQVFVAGGTPGAAGRIAILRAGSVCGEPGLFADAPRMANVEAMTPVVVWALRLPRFQELAIRVPAVALELTLAAGAVMAARMRANLSRQVPTA